MQNQQVTHTGADRFDGTGHHLILSAVRRQRTGKAISKRPRSISPVLLILISESQDVAAAEQSCLGETRSLIP